MGSDAELEVSQKKSAELSLQLNALLNINNALKGENSALKNTKNALKEENSALKKEYENLSLI